MSQWKDVNKELPSEDCCVLVTWTQKYGDDETVYVAMSTYREKAFGSKEKEFFSGSAGPTHDEIRGWRDLPLDPEGNPFYGSMAHPSFES